MNLEQAEERGYSLERASAFEVGLAYKGNGVRTWFSQTFDGKMPRLDHPEVIKAIEINEKETVG